MKKILVSAILGLAAIASVQAQSSIRLYNYGTPLEGNAVVYGAGTEGTIGTGVSTAGWTVGVYYALGDVTGAVNGQIGGATTTAGANMGSLAASGLTLATGAGSTAPLGSGGQSAGDYGTPTGLVLSGIPGTGSPTVTLVLVAYNGVSYEASTGRGHSAAFTMTAVSSPGFPLLTGNFANSFAVAAPEPSTFALAGLGLASLLIFRRRK
jgi:hypothetical protein